MPITMMYLLLMMKIEQTYANNDDVFIIHDEDNNGICYPAYREGSFIFADKQLTRFITKPCRPP